jgi:hypothetical protein
MRFFRNAANCRWIRRGERSIDEHCHFWRPVSASRLIAGRARILTSLARISPTGHDPHTQVSKMWVSGTDPFDERRRPGEKPRSLTVRCGATLDATDSSVFVGPRRPAKSSH